MFDLKESYKLQSSTEDRPIFEDLEGEAKAKAKDFKNCPQGQGRP